MVGAQRSRSPGNGAGWTAWMSRSLGWGVRETEDTLSRGPLLTGVAHRLWGLKEDRRPRPQEPPFAADVLFLPPKALTSWRLHLFPLKVPAKVSRAEEQGCAWPTPSRTRQPGPNLK